MIRQDQILLQATTENDKEVEEKEFSRQEPTHIPYDRLIVLEFEATCDDNPNNPASVQVTKVLGIPLLNLPDSMPFFIDQLAFFSPGKF